MSVAAMSVWKAKCPYFCDTILLVRVLQVCVDNDPKWYRREIVIYVAMNCLSACRTRHGDVAVDESELWLRTKDVLNDTHRMHIGIELAAQPLGCEWRYDADISCRFALIPLLELLSNIDSRVFDNLFVQCIDRVVVDSVLEDNEAVAVVVVQALLNCFQSRDARDPFLVCESDCDWAIASLIDLWGIRAFGVSASRCEGVLGRHPANKL